MKIIDNLEEYLLRYGKGEEVYSFLSKLNQESKNGKYVFDDDIYVNVMDTKTSNIENMVFESHRKYIDIHFLICGEERIYYSEGGKKIIKKEYDEENDYELFCVDGYKSVEYKKGQAVFFPINQAHLPSACINAPGKIKKAVIKVKA